MDELNDQRLQRLEKLNTLRSLGVPPYGTRFEVDHTVHQILSTHGAKTKEELEQHHIPCRIAGRVVALRRFGKAGFASLQEGADRLQVYLKKDRLGGRAVSALQGSGSWRLDWCGG